jgi:hypothetical protein
MKEYKELTADQLERLRGQANIYPGAIKNTEEDKKVYTAADVLRAEGLDPKATPTRQFGTGATRDSDSEKPDYEGFMSPLVQLRFGEYMHQHRKQSDGKMRDSDNWQKGIPKEQYIKSHQRHALDWWLIHRGFSAFARDTLEDILCGVLFNTQGYLHEILKQRYKEKADWCRKEEKI